MAVLIGLDQVSPWTACAAAALRGEPWLTSELALRTAALFGPMLLGAFTLAAIAWHLASSKANRRRMISHPAQPWLWREDWATGTVRLSNRTAIGFTVVSLSLYGWVVLPMGIYLASLKNAAAVYGFVALLGGVLLLFIRLLWLNRRWNRSQLQMHTLPGFIGGTFAATARLAEPFAQGTVFRVLLRCDMTRSTSVTSDGREGVVEVVLGAERSPATRSSLQTQTLHEALQRVTVDAAGAQAGVTVLGMVFAIPDGLPPTGKSQPPESERTFRVRMSDHCDWRVLIRLDSPADTRELVFEVPIFAAIPGIDPPQDKRASS